MTGSAQSLRAERPSTVAQLVAIVREAAATHSGLRIAGSMTWLDAGGPVRAASGVMLSGLSGISSYAPDDLTLTCGAGTTLEELDAVTRAHGQWCPLLPWGIDDGSVGATVATASTGPFAEAFGRPRNLVLGLECVDGTGRVINAGGRVVKNVAGFDLTRLMTGAWGTLGVITQVHLRLRARPVVDETWSVAAPLADSAKIEAFAKGPLAPLLCMRPKSLKHGFGDEQGCWLVRLGGNRSYVDASRAVLKSLGQAMQLDEAFWAPIRIGDAPEAPTAQWRWDALSLRLRDRFDPQRILNPGLLGEPA